MFVRNNRSGTCKRPSAHCRAASPKSYFPQARTLVASSHADAAVPRSEIAETGRFRICRSALAWRLLAAVIGIFVAPAPAGNSIARSAFRQIAHFRISNERLACMTMTNMPNRLNLRFRIVDVYG